MHSSTEVLRCKQEAPSRSKLTSDQSNLVFWRLQYGHMYPGGAFQALSEPPDDEYSAFGSNCVSPSVTRQARSVSSSKPVGRGLGVGTRRRHDKALLVTISSPCADIGDLAALSSLNGSPTTQQVLPRLSERRGTIFSGSMAMITMFPARILAMLSVPRLSAKFRPSPSPERPSRSKTPMDPCAHTHPPLLTSRFPRDAHGRGLALKLRHPVLSATGRARKQQDPRAVVDAAGVAGVGNDDNARAQGIAGRGEGAAAARRWAAREVAQGAEAQRLDLLRSVCAAGVGALRAASLRSRAPERCGESSGCVMGLRSRAPREGAGPPPGEVWRGGRSRNSRRSWAIKDQLCWKSRAHV